jgi:hypothetical protein
MTEKRKAVRLTGNFNKCVEFSTRLWIVKTEKKMKMIELQSERKSNKIEK